MFKLVKYSLRLLPLVIITTSLSVLSVVFAQAVAAAGPASTAPNTNTAPANQVADQIDQPLANGVVTVSDNQSTQSSSTSSSNTTTIVGGGSDSGGNGTGSAIIEQGGNTLSVNGVDQTLSSKSDQAGTDQQSSGKTLSASTDSANPGDPSGGTASGGTTNGTTQSSGTTASFVIPASPAAGSTSRWTHAVMQSSASSELPVTTPAAPVANSPQLPAPTMPPINPLTSTGMILMFGQFGVSASSFTTAQQSAFTHLIAWQTSHISRLSALFTLTSLAKTQSASWLLLAAAILGVGIVALWRRGGYSYAPRSHTLSNVNFGLALKRSLGAILPNSAFYYLCLPGGGTV